MEPVPLLLEVKTSKTVLTGGWGVGGGGNLLMNRRICTNFDLNTNQPPEEIK